MDGDWMAFLQALVGTVFALAALAKVITRASITPFLTALGFSTAAAVRVSRAVPVVEGAIGVLLILDLAPTATRPVATVVSLGFFVALALARRSDVKEGCRCFGALDGQDLSPLALVRALLLLFASFSLSVGQLRSGFRWMGADWVHSPVSGVLGMSVAVLMILAFALLEQVESFHDRRLQVLPSSTVNTLTSGEDV